MFPVNSEQQKVCGRHRGHRSHMQIERSMFKMLINFYRETRQGRILSLAFPNRNRRKSS